MRTIKWIGLILSIGVLVMGCSNESKFSPEQIISHAIEGTETLDSYYAEATLTVSDKNNIIDKNTVKEWRQKDGKIRIETEDENGNLISIAVNNGNQVTTYEPEENQAIIIDDPEIMALNQRSPKEQADQLLGFVQDTHDLTMNGEVEIAGRNTHHLIATPREDNSLFGKQEMWIDKESWLVLKMIHETGDHTTEVVYEEIDFGVNIGSDKFSIDLPSDVHMIDLDDVHEKNEVTINEAEEALEQPFLYVPEDNDIHISTIEMHDLTGIVNRVEIDMEYMKDDLPFISLSLFETPDDIDDDMSFPGEESTTIRGEEATYTEIDDFRSLVWDEDGLRYSILIIDPNVTLEDIQALAETMEMVGEEKSD